MIKVFENFIPLSYQNKLEHTFLNPNHEWFYRANTLGSKDNIQGYVGFYEGECYEDTDYLVNPIHNGTQPISPYYQLIKPLLYFFEDKTNLKILNIVRMKVNLLTPAGYNRQHPPHVDYTSKNSYTLLYYVNDSDGDTTFYNEFYTGGVQTQMTKNCSFTPTRGTAVIFPSAIFHAGSSPIKNVRCAINIIVNVDL